MYRLPQIIIAVLLVFAAVSLNATELTGDAYFVEHVNGVPQIRKNGTSISSRMAYVCAKSHMTVDIPPGKQETVFPFRLFRDVPYVNIFIFFMDIKTGMVGGSMEISNLCLKDVTTGEIVQKFDLSISEFSENINWGFRDRHFDGDRSKLPLKISIGERNMVGEHMIRFVIGDNPDDCLQMRNFGLQLKHIADLKKDHEYELHMTTNADRNFTTVAPVDAPGGWALYPGANFTETVKFAREAGVLFFETGVIPLWADENHPADSALTDAVMRTLLNTCPDAQVIMRFMEELPEWWIEENPDELMRFDDTPESRYPSIASHKYRQDHAAAIRRTIRHLESEYGKNMAGYHPCGGNTQEWFYNRVWDNAYCGYDGSTLKEFREYLRKKYRTDAELSRAWNQTGITVTTAAVPAPAERRRNDSVFYDLSINGNIIDFNDFIQLSMVGAINDAARVIREECGRKRLSLIFYGYNYEFLGLPSGAASSGHYAMRELLNSPYVDIVAGPISYSERALGKGETTMGATESVLAAGKLWLNENDNSLHIAFQRGNGAAGYAAAVRTAENSFRILKRSIAVTAIRNISTWWMDLYGVGWFNTPDFWILMKKSADMDRDFIENPEVFTPETALVFDEKSISFVAPGGHGALKQIQAVRGDAFRTGTTLGMYLFDDFLNGRIPAQANYILGAFALDAKQRRQMRTQLQAKPAIIGWAAGFIDRDSRKTSLAAITEATGFEIAKILQADQAGTEITRDGNAFGLKRKSRGSGPISPLFVPVVKAEDVILMSYRNGEPAVVLRPGTVPLIFCGTPDVSPDLYCAFIRRLNLRVYADKPSYIYAAKEYTAIILPSGGEFTIDTGWPGKVRNVFTGESYGIGPKIKISGTKGDVFLLQNIGSPKYLVPTGKSVFKSQSPSTASPSAKPAATVSNSCELQSVWGVKPAF